MRLRIADGIRSRSRLLSTVLTVIPTCYIFVRGHGGFLSSGNCRICSDVCILGASGNWGLRRTFGWLPPVLPDTVCLTSFFTDSFRIPVFRRSGPAFAGQSIFSRCIPCYSPNEAFRNRPAAFEVMKLALHFSDAVTPFTSFGLNRTGLFGC